MTEYLLDTHVVIWLLTNDKRLNKAIREDIEYYQHQYHVSQFSLLELVQLQQLGKADLKKSFVQVQKLLQDLNIAIDTPLVRTFSILEKMPFLNINGTKHSDMIDRYLVANAIAGKMTLISADQKLPYYRKCGLTLIEV